MKIILSGAGGKMGRAVIAAAEKDDDIKIVCGIDAHDDNMIPFPVYPNFRQADKADAIIDFSNPSLTMSLLKYAVETRTPAVIATTGLNQAEIKQIERASKCVPIFFSANMSLGINLLTALSKKAADILGGSFDIEIIEWHHNQKLDAPSGTALMIADAINDARQNKYEYSYDRHNRREKRRSNEIGISSLRGGTIVGKHQVVFAGNDEVIELTHTATSKAVFASGAIAAAKFLTGKENGLYSMDDMI